MDKMKNMVLPFIGFAALSYQLNMSFLAASFCFVMCAVYLYLILLLEKGADKNDLRNLEPENRTSDKCMANKTKLLLDINGIQGDIYAKQQLQHTSSGIIVNEDSGGSVYSKKEEVFNKSIEQLWNKTSICLSCGQTLSPLKGGEKNYLYSIMSASEGQSQAKLGSFDNVSSHIGNIPLTPEFVDWESLLQILRKAMDSLEEINTNRKVDSEIINVPETYNVLSPPNPLQSIENEDVFNNSTMTSTSKNLMELRKDISSHDANHTRSKHSNNLPSGSNQSLESNLSKSNESNINIDDSLKTLDKPLNSAKDLAELDEVLKLILFPATPIVKKRCNNKVQAADSHTSSMSPGEKRKKCTFSDTASTSPSNKTNKDATDISPDVTEQKPKTSGFRRFGRFLSHRSISRSNSTKSENFTPMFKQPKLSHYMKKSKSLEDCSEIPSVVPESPRTLSRLFQKYQRPKINRSSSSTTSVKNTNKSRSSTLERNEFFLSIRNSLRNSKKEHNT